MDTKQLLRAKLKEKIAAPVPVPRAPWKFFGKTVGEGFKRALGMGLGLGGAGLALGVTASAASDGFGSLVRDPIKKKVGLRRMYREHDWLNREDDGTVKKYFNTLFRF